MEEKKFILDSDQQFKSCQKHTDIICASYSTNCGISAFFTFAIMLSLLVFIFEGIRDAFDPRKTFK